MPFKLCAILRTQNKLAICPALMLLTQQSSRGDHFSARSLHTATKPVCVSFQSFSVQLAAVVWISGSSCSSLSLSLVVLVALVAEKREKQLIVTHTHTHIHNLRAQQPIWGSSDTVSACVVVVPSCRLDCSSPSTVDVLLGRSDVVSSTQTNHTPSVYFVRTQSGTRWNYLPRIDAAR